VKPTRAWLSGGTFRARVTFSEPTMRHVTFHADWRGMAVQASALRGKTRFGAAVRNPNETGNNFQGGAGQAQAWHGAAWLYATRGDTAGQFARARRSKACLGMAKNGGAIRNLERHLGQFSEVRQGSPGPGTVWRGEARRGNNVTGDGNPGHFPKHQEAPANRGAMVEGMTEET
jgi:hypothetical protein